MYKYLLAACAVFVTASAHAAAMPKFMGDYGDWSTWTYTEGGSTICYMSSTPKKDEGKYKKRGDIYAVITHRPSENSFDEVSFIAGYQFDTKAPMTIKIGNKIFSNTYTEGDKAWMSKSSDDVAVVAAMKRGDRMIVDGKSNRGTATKDTYSLKGFTSAYNAISTKCKK